jgi:hypothetical protein
MSEIEQILRFQWEGLTYEHAPMQPTLHGKPRSWPYDSRPTVAAQIPLVAGGAVEVLALAERWGEGFVLVRWVDDNDKTLNGWVPTTMVRKLTPSEWDIEQYRRCPPHLRGIQWGNRLPGFLPD